MRNKIFLGGRVVRTVIASGLPACQSTGSPAVLQKPQEQNLSAVRNHAGRRVFWQLATHSHPFTQPNRAVSHFTCERAMLWVCVLVTSSKRTWCAHLFLSLTLLMFKRCRFTWELPVPASGWSTSHKPQHSALRGARFGGAGPFASDGEIDAGRESLYQRRVVRKQLSLGLHMALSLNHCAPSSQASRVHCK